ncbi:putative Heterokaryon incompatibility domain-containing protein [Seiridium unicorne]|uniref:Heterokaryon incompatibility domain-containing protein n=1 Tax=Seiridium unicorne TaxID=138068 RepID=A0ABR2UYB0_9PEZI
MRLCGSCSRLEIQKLPPSRHPQPPGFKLGTLRQVWDRADRCALCEIILAHLLDSSYFAHYATAKGVAESKANLTVSLLRQPKDSFAPKETTHLHGFDVSFGPGELTFSVNLYAPRGSPAAVSGDVANQDVCMSVDPNSLTPSDITRKWLDQCMSEHTTCRESFSGEYVEDSPGIAPRRLLAIAPPKQVPGPPSIRLIEPARPFKADYVSLSHCWGPPENRPLCTVQANLDKHLAQVPWSSLSQTFQDAFLLCAELGVEYIWIDSLCIIQDDSADWRHEAAIMCRVYEESKFTIAASSASNSSQGLFGVRSELKVAELPYHHGQTGASGVIYAYSSPPGSSNILDKVPLSERGWVLQEYVLSRRTIHFTSFGLVWTCSRDPAIQRSEFQGLGSHLVPNTWIGMIREYTKRDLTFKSDKLVAIQGLANAWARRTRNTYYYGIFLEDLPYSLAWSGRGTLESRLVRDVGSGIPTWTWASTTGRIDFDSVVLEDQSATISLGISIEPFDALLGALCLRSIAMEVTSFHGPFECLPRSIEELREVDLDPSLFPASEGRKWCNHSNHPERFFMMANGCREAVGWGAFDEGAIVPTVSVYCLPLVKAPTQPWFLPPIDTKEPFFLWCLLLCHDHERGAYERVGYGRILDTSWTSDEVEKDIVLI